MILLFKGASLMAQMVKNLPTMQETRVGFLGWEDTVEDGSGGRHGNPLHYSCLENSHGQRNLVGYNPWGCEKLEMTE